MRNKKEAVRKAKTASFYYNIYKFKEAQNKGTHILCRIKFAITYFALFIATLIAFLNSVALFQKNALIAVFYQQFQ